MGRVRRADGRDIDTLVDLHARFCEADGHAFSEEAARRGLSPLLEDDRFGVVWIVDDPEAAGYAVVTWGWSIESGGPDALLDEIYVEPTGQGVGFALMEALLSDVADRGIETTFLETESSNRAARRFYQRFDFAADDSIWMVRRGLSPRP